PAAVDDRRVVELVGEHEHVGPAEGREDAEVRGEAGGEQSGPGAALPAGERALERAVHGTRSDDQAGRTGTGTPAIERVVRGAQHLRVGRETEGVGRRV